jgi:cellulose synthase/poly-beta-1,6-N-acetylglucosamine synthase-like glycosyltransferase
MISLIILMCICFIVLYPGFEILRWRKKELGDFGNFTIKQAVSVILIVNNEERNIARKIQEILNEPIWLEGSELIIVSAGSIDETNSILNTYAKDSRIKVFIFSENNSKIESLNFAIPKSRNEILVFSDCRQVMENCSIFNLVKKLELEKLDVVNSTLINVNTPKKSIRNYINLMNIKKSINSNAMNVYGALYAQRKSTTTAIPSNIIFDDLYVLASALSRNLKIKQCEDAVIKDAKFVNYYAEERIRRLTRGLMLFLFRHFGLIMKMSLRNRFHFIMSKYAKLLIPILFLLLLLSSFPFTLFNANPVIISIVFIILSVLIVLKGTYFLHFFNLMYFTIKAQYLFIFKNERSVRWEKFKNY